MANFPALGTQTHPLHPHTVRLCCASFSMFSFLSLSYEYYLKVFELLDLLQCIATHLQHTRLGFLERYPDLFSCDFHSRLVARSRKPFMLEALLRRCNEHPSVRKKQTDDSEASNSDTLIDSTGTVYPFG